MANDYGVANPLPLPTFQSVIGGADIAVSAGVETNIFQATLAGLDASGFYYPSVDGFLVVSLGATPPTALGLAIRIGAGADIVTYNVNSLLLVANANVFYMIRMIGAAAQAPWQGAGSLLNVTMNPTAQAVTVRTAGSRCLFSLQRAPDQ